MKTTILITMLLLPMLLASCPAPATVQESPGEYSVTYNANGAKSGSVPVDPAVYGSSSTATVLGNTGSLARSGYSFGGWNTASDGTGTDYAVSANMAIAGASKTLYAKWNINPGEGLVYSAGGRSFTMRIVPGNISFPTGIDDSSTSNNPSAYWIGETEVTYRLWYTVRPWALNNGYALTTWAAEGNDGTPGAAPVTQEPVTGVTLFDCMVFCNALTEWYNAQTGASLVCVYQSGGTPIRTTANGDVCNAAIPTPAATGFRLPSLGEWEFAARYRSDAVNTVAGYSNPWFTRGNSASHAYTYYNDTSDSNPANSIVDNREANDAVAVYGYYYTGGTPNVALTVSPSVTLNVTSKQANSLGLYLMSGNVEEFCWDKIDEWRYACGGHFASVANDLRIGRRNALGGGWTSGNGYGFRIAMND